MNKKTALGLITLISTLPLLVFAQRDISCSITATPTRAAPGEHVTLRWNSQNVRSATLVGFGPVPLSGSRVVQATQTTDYKLMASGYENNHVGCVARITVTPKQPTCNISLVPFAVASNNFATLSWSTDHADSVYISGIGNVQPKGNQMVRAVGNTTYHLTARSAGGICERSAELSVRDQYSSFGYIPQTIQSVFYPLFGYQQQNPRSTPSYNYQQSYPWNSYSTSEVVDSWDETVVDRWDETVVDSWDEKVVNSWDEQVVDSWDEKVVDSWDETVVDSWDEKVVDSWDETVVDSWNEYQSGNNYQAPSAPGPYIESPYVDPYWNNQPFEGSSLQTEYLGI